MTDEMSQQTKKCPSCQKEVSFSITKCPYCGRDFRSWFKQHPILAGLGAIIAFFFLIGLLGSSTTEEKGVPTTKPEPTTEEVTTSKPEEEKEEKPAPQTKTYQQVFTFSGNGAKKSEPFTITGGRFKIKYDCKGDLCQAYLKKSTSEWDIQLIMNSANPVKDETIVYGAGEYYIDSNSIGSYSMVVEDYK